MRIFARAALLTPTPFQGSCSGLCVVRIAPTACAAWRPAGGHRRGRAVSRFAAMRLLTASCSGLCVVQIAGDRPGGQRRVGGGISAGEDRSDDPAVVGRLQRVVVDPHGDRAAASGGIVAAIRVAATRLLADSCNGLCVRVAIRPTVRAAQTTGRRPAAGGAAGSPARSAGNSSTNHGLRGLSATFSPIAAAIPEAVNCTLEGFAAH
jgi:hypothetical protein